MEKFFNDGYPTIFGQNAPYPLFALIGQTLTHWEMLETTLAQLFAALVSPKTSMTAMEVFGRLQNSSTRHELLAVSVDAFFNDGRRYPDLFKEAKALLLNIEHMRGIRNKLAHGTVTRWSDAAKDCGFWLLPPVHNTKHGSLLTGPNFHIGVEHIEKFMALVIEKGKAASEFVWKFENRQIPPGSFP